MVRSTISNARWIAYDIPGNVGWIAFLTGLILCFTKRPEIMENRWIFILLCLALLCCAAMLVGIGELISERVQKLDRVLPKKRLYRGFGALTFSGLAGMLISLSALAIALAKALTGAEYLGLLSVGALLCFVFGGLLLREYRPAHEAEVSE